MSRHSAFASLALALALSGLCQAGTWPNGILTGSWDTLPPAYCDPDASFNASASANYDPNLPEGTEWDWVNLTYTFSWDFSEYGTGSWTSSGNQSNACGSFFDTNNPGGEMVVAFNVNVGGQFIVYEGDGSQNIYDIETPQANGAPVPVDPRVTITNVVLVPGYRGNVWRVDVTTNGTAFPIVQGQAVAVTEAWSGGDGFNLGGIVGPVKTEGIPPGNWTCGRHVGDLAWTCAINPTDALISLWADYQTGHAKLESQPCPAPPR